MIRTMDLEALAVLRTHPLGGKTTQKLAGLPLKTEEILLIVKQNRRLGGKSLKSDELGCFPHYSPDLSLQTPLL